MCKFCGLAGHNPIADIEALLERVQCTNCGYETKKSCSGLYYCFNCKEFMWHDTC